MHRHPIRRAVPACLGVILLAGCVSPDPPLLVTSLPNGYTFRSNGGDVGYFSLPPRGKLHGFGLLDHHSEYWCAEFGWEAAMAICRYQRATPRADVDVGFFILDTRNGAVVIARDAAAALA